MVKHDFLVKKYPAIFHKNEEDELKKIAVLI